MSLNKKLLSYSSRKSKRRKLNKNKSIKSRLIINKLKMILTCSWEEVQTMQMLMEAVPKNRQNQINHLATIPTGLNSQRLLVKILQLWITQISSIIRINLVYQCTAKVLIMIMLLIMEITNLSMKSKTSTINSLIPLPINNSNISRFQILS